MTANAKYLVQTIDCFDGELATSLMTKSEIAELLETNNIAGIYQQIRIFDVSVIGEFKELETSEFWCPSRLGVAYVSDADYYDAKEEW